MDAVARLMWGTPRPGKAPHHDDSMNFEESSPSLPDFGACVRSTRASDAAFFAAFDEQRAKVLRKRIQWYCILAVWLLSVAACGSFLSLVQNGWISRADWVQMLSNSSLIVLYAVALVYLARAKPDRTKLVKLLTTLTSLVLLVGMPFEVITRWASPEFAQDAASMMQQYKDMGYSVTISFGLIFGLACVLVPMTMRESGKIAGIGFGLFAIITTTLIHPPIGTLVWMLVLFAAFTAPGMAWSWWRFKEFDARFRADTLLAKYQSLRGEAREISAELSQARRLHEALFPRAISAGTLQMGYAYEPMREIGGDFLFVHREAASATNPGHAAITLVLIDVSGHGIPAALSVNRLHGELLRFFSNYPGASGEAGRPGHVLSNLNTYACAALAPQGVYATALVVRSCPTVGTLEFASAGHPTAYVRRAAGVGGAGEAITELPSTATMLGVLDAETFHPEARELNLHPGDRLVAYTDGAMETRDAAQADFTAARIREMVASAALPDKPGTGRLAPIADAIMAAVNAHRHGPVQDDTLVVELSHTGTVAKTPAREKAADDLTESRL